VDQTRGFGGGTTSSDPYLTQWARGDRDARHQFTYNIGYTIRQAVSITAFGRVQSGNPFTPMTSGDVNGDGYNNDRAFIYNPTSTTDPVLAASMASLLSNAPASVRDCLQSSLDDRRQEQPPESVVDEFEPARRARVAALKIPDRATISLESQPLTGIDAWSTGRTTFTVGGAVHDPTLPFVRGFDPATQRYTYDVNPRFGANRQASALNLAPATLDVRFDVGPSASVSSCSAATPGSWRLGNKMSENQIKQQFVRTPILREMLRQQDSLGLSNDVADSIAI
jgi:hypothetical protein